MTAISQLQIIVPVKYAGIVEEILNPRVYKMKRSDEGLIVTCPARIYITRDSVKMTPREFSRFINSIKVKNGRKVKDRNNLWIEPKRDKVIRIRLASSELALIKDVMKRREIENLSNFLREVIFWWIFQELDLIPE